jgi:hypothetical protein
MLIPESSWFSVNYAEVGTHLMNCFLRYKEYKDKSKQQALYSASNFSFEKMKEKLNLLFIQYLPEFPKEVKLVLPQISKMELPKLKKIE